MEIKAITLPESRDKDACYDFFFRVYRWWYNHNNDEALSEELFREREDPFRSDFLSFFRLENTAAIPPALACRAEWRPSSWLAC